MKWTKEKPSISDKYFYRETKFNRVEIIRVDCAGEEWAYGVRFGLEDETPIREMTGEWSDIPIPEPEEA